MSNRSVLWRRANANRSDIDLHVDPLSWEIAYGIYAYSWGYLRDVRWAARQMVVVRPTAIRNSIVVVAEALSASVAP